MSAGGGECTSKCGNGVKGKGGPIGLLLFNTPAISMLESNKIVRKISKSSVQVFESYNTNSHVLLCMVLYFPFDKWYIHIKVD